MKNYVRRVALFLVLAMVVAACTESDSESTTTTSDLPETTKAPAEPQNVSINESLGGTQAVQDFVIYMAMWEVDSGELIDLYDDAVGLAQAETGDSDYQLGGGFDLEAAEGLEGEIVGASGESLTSLSVDYGLISYLDENAEESARELDRVLGDKLAIPVSDAMETPLLIEVITADYSASRTHAGPDDLVQMDLTLVESLEVGDQVVVSYVFGQTLPGDPDIEAGMQPMELLVYRWNQGLVRVLSDAADEIEVFYDYSAEVVEGSKKLSRAAKEALLDEILLERFNEGSANIPSEEEIYDLAQVDFENVSALGSFDGPDGSEDLFFIVHNRRGNDDGWFLVIDVPEDLSAECRSVLSEPLDGSPPPAPSDRPPGRPDASSCGVGPNTTLPIFTLHEFFKKVAFDIAVKACVEKAVELNRNNGAATPVGEILAAGRTAEVESSASSSTIADTPTTATTEPLDPLAPQPGPVSCGPPPDPGEFPPKPPAGVAYGDIHINTIDGKHYANHAVGEFLFFDNGVAEVQIRTEPWQARPFIFEVSVATAVAARVDGRTISMHRDGSTYVDGERVDLVRGESTPISNAQVLWWGDGWVVIWPDGTILRVEVSVVGQILAVVTPGAGGTPRGLLGNFDGDQFNDFITRDGEVLDPNTERDHELLYGTFVDSWRISEEESAFFYEDGESTSTFTLADFPSAFVTVADLPPEMRTEAEAICSEVGVEREQMFLACVVDVGVTGEPAFAYQAFVAETVAPESENVPTNESPGPGTETNLLTIGDLTIAFGPNPPILDPGGVAPSWTCESADGVYTAISSFPETPTVRYEVDLQYISPDNPRGLAEQFRLIVLRNSEPYAWVQTNAEQFADSVDTVEVDGVVLSASGQLFLNDPPQPGLQPVSQLPPGTVLDDFDLKVSCGS